MNEILEYDYVLSLDDEKSVLVNTILLDFLGFYQEQNGLLTEEKKRILYQGFQNEKLSNKRSNIKTYTKLKVKEIKLLAENVPVEIFAHSSFMKDPLEDYTDEKIRKLK